MRETVIALLIPLVDSAVRWAEGRFGKGADKRAAACKYVKNRLLLIQALLGKFSLDVQDSVILGLVDAAVESFHQAGEFQKHKTDTRLYVIPEINRDEEFDFVPLTEESRQPKRK